MNKIIPTEHIISLLFVGFIALSIGATIGFKYGELNGVSKEQKKEIRKYKELIKEIENRN